MDQRYPFTQDVVLPYDIFAYICKFLENDIRDILRFRAINKNGLKHFQKYVETHHISLYKSKIDDNGLYAFKNVCEIYLCGSRKFTDAGLAYLTRANYISMGGCHQITDVGLSNLSTMIKQIVISHHRTTHEARQKLRKHDVRILIVS